jgi:predicted ATPase/class 3 adenylate cyclase
MEQTARQVEPQVRLPGGTVTLLFTDIEQSTRLLIERGERYAEALATHHQRLREASARYGGIEVGTWGDAFFLVFTGASEAVAAARDAQQALAHGPIRVRMGIHTGEPQLTDEGYVGIDVHRAARICSVTHGGQVVLSARTHSLLDPSVLVTDLGLHRLKDLGEPEKLFQLGDGRYPPLRSLHTTNLPAPPSPLVGRVNELEKVLSLLRTDARVVTLTGAGGAGKTRLAVEAAAGLVDDFRDGVFWVPLAALRDPELVLPTMEEILGAKVPLAEYVDQKSMLLLLDNLEQVIDVGTALAEVLAQCPNLRLLTTSRIPLRIRAEREYRLPPMREDDSVALFCACAVDVAPGAIVSEICRRLDGVPLAIELAAARTRDFPLEELLQRLERPLRVLTEGARDAPDRQLTMHATIAWSYDLLSPEEQGLFRRLAVFAGGFTLEAAEEVSGAHLDELNLLADKSLVRRTTDRYWMLEPVREYALERLEEARESEALGRKHAEWSLALAEEIEQGLTGLEQKALMERVDVEHENIRLSLAWAIAGNHDPDMGLRLASAIRPYWEVRMYQTEGQRWLERALAQAAEASPTARVKALIGAGILAERDPAAARPFLQEALTIARRSGDRRLVASALHRMGRLEALLDNGEEARSLLEECLRIARELGDRESTWESLNNLAAVASTRGRFPEARALTEDALVCAQELGDMRRIARSRSSFGYIAYAEGDLEAARSLHSETLAIARELGDRWREAVALEFLGCVAYAQGDVAAAGDLQTQALIIHRASEDTFGTARSLMWLGAIALDRGDVPGARVVLEESLAVQRNLGDPIQAGDVLGTWAALIASEGHPERAARLLSAVEATREAVGYVRPVPEQVIWERRLAAVRDAIDDELLAAAFEDGRQMSQDEALDYAMRDEP